MVTRGELKKALLDWRAWFITFSDQLVHRKGKKIAYIPLYQWLRRREGY